MKTYRLSPACITRLLRRNFLVALSLAVPMTGAALFFLALQSPGEYAFLLIAVPVLAAVIAVSLFRATGRNRRLLGSYRLTLEEDAITRTQEGLADLTIFRTEVTRVVE